MSLGIFSGFLNDPRWPSLLEGGVVPGQVGLGYIRKVAECELWSKLTSSVPQWSVVQFMLPDSYSELPLWHPSMMDSNV